MEKFKVGQRIKRIRLRHSMVDIGDIVYVREVLCSGDDLRVSKMRGGERIPSLFSSCYFEAQETCGTEWSDKDKRLLLCQNSK